jgi:hypothetical protein
MHRYGKSWVNISKCLVNRTALQCRTHGQKYLQNLEFLLDRINRYLSHIDKEFKDELHLKIKKYEDDCMRVVEAFILNEETHLIELRLFPRLITQKYMKSFSQS